MFQTLSVSFRPSVIIKAKNTVVFRVSNSLGLNFVFIMVHASCLFQYSSKVLKTKIRFMILIYFVLMTKQMHNSYNQFYSTVFVCSTCSERI